MTLNHSIATEVLERFPDYSAIILEVRGLAGGPSDERSEALLKQAETATLGLIETTPLDQLPEVLAWRDAYATFGVKPRVARSSVEALMRRVETGLPRVDLLTDIYNAVSVLHRVPIGGENLDAYSGPAHLVVAIGTEEFETRNSGEVEIQNPDAGEIVWRDDAGVTCRRWNWRQCLRTRLDTQTSNVLFIIDGLGAQGKASALAAADRLRVEITSIWSAAEISTQILGS